MSKTLRAARMYMYLNPVPHNFANYSRNYHVQDAWRHVWAADCVNSQRFLRSFKRPESYVQIVRRTPRSDIAMWWCIAFTDPSDIWLCICNSVLHAHLGMS
jgi:hypothetical protein